MRLLIDSISHFAALIQLSIERGGVLKVAVAYVGEHSENAVRGVEGDFLRIIELVNIFDKLDNLVLRQVLDAH